MHSSILFAISPIIALGSCHAVILNAQGIAGSPASVGFGVDPAIPRDCVDISPCQLDSGIMRSLELKKNKVNFCGRTELGGNIDVAASTEDALAAGAVTQVQAGTGIAVTIHQVNADGGGPYACDLDEASNVGSKLTNLTVRNNVPGVNGISRAKMQNFDMIVEMPDKFKCIGASAGNVCTVRCRNPALAGDFGGCFAVQQTDTNKTVNSVDNETEQDLKLIKFQEQQNQADLPDALEAHAKAVSDESVKNLAVVNALLNKTVVSQPSPQQTLAPGNGGVGDGSVNLPNKGGNGGNGGNGGDGNGVDNGNRKGKKGGNNGGNKGGNGGNGGNGNGVDNGNKRGNKKGNKGGNGGNGGDGNGGNGGNGNGVDNGNKGGNKGGQGGLGGLGGEDGQGGQGGAKNNRGNRKQSKKNRIDNIQK